MAWRTGVASAALAAALLGSSIAHGADAPAYDLLIRDGVIYDGSGGEAYRGDIAISGDKIVAVGKSVPGTARQVVDANGLAVAPGFINMLGDGIPPDRWAWAERSSPGRDARGDGRGVVDGAAQ